MLVFDSFGQIGTWRGWKCDPKLSWYESMMGQDQLGQKLRKCHHLGPRYDFFTKKISDLLSSRQSNIYCCWCQTPCIPDYLIFVTYVLFFFISFVFTCKNNCCTCQNNWCTCQNNWCKIYFGRWKNYYRHPNVPSEKGVQHRVPNVPSDKVSNTGAPNNLLDI